jgi:hypothetical protein
MQTHPPTPNDLIVGIDRVESMLSDMIKVCECIKHPRRTPTSSSSMPIRMRNAALVASRYMKHMIQIESRPKTLDCGNRKNHLHDPCPVNENPKHTAR